MCRWLAYSGSALPVEELLYKPRHSLIDQSLNARLGPHATNGDGFGLGWYGVDPVPALYKSVEPAWNDRNLWELSRQIRSELIFAHVRASTGTPTQRTNCHPFRHGQWLWMHNGQIARFAEMKRDIILAIDPTLYPFIEGSTDTEVFFFLALTFGLNTDPPGAVARATERIEDIARQHGVDHPVRMTLAVSDGKTIWAFRYASTGEPPSLYYSDRVDAIRAQYPEDPVMRQLSESSRLIVSEPPADLDGAWVEMPASAYAVIHDGEEILHDFAPLPTRGDSV